VLKIEKSGGEEGIRTLGTGVSPNNGLANESFRRPHSFSNTYSRTGCLPRRAPCSHSAIIVLHFVLQSFVPEGGAHITASEVIIAVAASV
jgi:hypothetical protein